MRTRGIEARDVPVLESIYNGLEYGFPFPDFLSPEFESVVVVVDDEDRPIMACGAKKTVELIMICDQKPHVAVRLQGIALIHDVMRKILNRLGYKEAQSFVSPHLEKTPGRTMERRFGWVTAWTGYRVV